MTAILFVCHVPPFVSFAETELRKLEPDVEFASVASLEALARIPEATLARARLIGFATGLVIPAAVLGGLGAGAYNFHPGPPEFPGWDPIRFALYEDARAFGVTAHAMAARVDAGAIVGARRFPLREGATYADVQAGMVEALLALFRELVPALLSPAGPSPIAETWGPRRYTRRRAAALCEITPDIDPDEFRRRIRAFGDGELGLRPTMRLHGASFVYAPDAILRG